MTFSSAHCSAVLLRSFPLPSILQLTYPRVRGNRPTSGLGLVKNWQLEAVVIGSEGISDAQTRYFDPTVYIANYSIPINPGRQADHIIIRRVAIVEVAGKDDARAISVDGCLRLAPVAAIVVRGSGVGNIELTTTRF